MKYITRVKLKNFKRFTEIQVPLQEKLNIIIGENESGKSTILSAISLVLGGNRGQIEKIGYERLLNHGVVSAFLESERRYEDLPKAYVELWFNDFGEHELDGRNNSEGVDGHGLKMEFCPNDEFGPTIRQILQGAERNFPFEFYQVRFYTFQGDAYSGYKKYVRHIVIDTSQIGNDYAVREYVGDMYDTYAEPLEKVVHQNEYRKLKEGFGLNVMKDLNERAEKYSFALKSDSKSNIRTDLTLIEESIGIENKGKGRQCFIKTEFALKRAEGVRQKIDVALIEEPENHLSHLNMKRLVGMIAAADDKQLIIATHSNMISSRLDLRNTIYMHSADRNPILLTDLPDDTAEFFIKAPYHGILDYVLSKKVILVEGDSEYILMAKFYEMVKGHSMDTDQVHVFSVGGTSFKRYLDVANLLGIKTAVVRDNDTDYQRNCVELYEDYNADHIKVFSDQDNGRSTFEKCLYQDNEAVCTEWFAAGRKTLTVQEYMLKNKAESALEILRRMQDGFAVPQYIREAIEWISG
ncbi:MAG: AAA family ATPase [Pseudomonadales bacterium]|nr:AAA family ATPase [Pseudomonadales bacterium]